MYFKELKLWNFRKFGTDEPFDIAKPNLVVPFHEGLNVLIGENDSGKTAIIDAIKLVLKTHSYEWIRIEPEDFYKNTIRLRIECWIHGLSDNEAKNFIEWLGYEGEGENAKPYLKLILDVSKKGDNILPYEARSGADEEGSPLQAEAKEYLKTTYLKPLRDAKEELAPKRNSKLSRILRGHVAFKGREDDHEFLELFKKLKDGIEEYFKSEGKDGKLILNKIETYLEQFFGENTNAIFSVSEQKLKNILETLKLTLYDENLGLGSHNLLFIATELLLLEREDYDGLRLGLIEEIEAHLHPQAQLKIIEYLQDLANVQIILTTHSPNLASKVKLHNLFLCHGSNVFPMGKDYTQLKHTDYYFLETFLDVTKANLFFARGVMIVEGWSEGIIIPAIAKKIGIDLTKKGVSIINVGNTAYLRYANIFKRKDENESINIPVAIVSDLDIKPEEEIEQVNGKTKKQIVIEAKEKIKGQKVQIFVSPHWTLEWCLTKSCSIGTKFQEIVKEIHSRTDWTDFDNKLSEKLVNKRLDKVGIAYKLAESINNDNTITIHIEDIHIKYLIDAIKYAAS